MTASRTAIAVALAFGLALVVVAFGFYRLGEERGASAGVASSAGAMSSAGTPASAAAAEGGEDATRRHLQAGLKAGDVDPTNGKRILYYHDPMVPASRFDKPGKSPFMDMMMSPVYAGGEADAGAVAVSPRIQQSIGVRTAEVRAGTLSPSVSAVGSVAFNERDQAIVQARATGYVEKLLVRATLDPVAKGQPLAELYVPDWIAAQEEFLAVRAMRGVDLGALVDGARQRMRQVGMSDEQIRLVEGTGRTQPRIAVRAPIGGVVAELMAREGMTVSAGTTLFRINGLSTVWANAEVPETQAALLRPGAAVRGRSPAAPGVTFDGKVQAILPEVSTATRTLKARMELANPQHRLVPGMFVQMEFTGMRPEQTLMVPTEAVIQTGRRSVVMLAEEGGRFRPVDVQTGLESNGQTEIRSGLKAGQRVVVSSQFLIDSEASLRGLETRLNAAEPGASRPGASAAASAGSAAPRHVGVGKVEAVTADSVTLSHGPIPSMKWGAMTMDFKRPPGTAAGIKPGDSVRFEFSMDRDGMPQLAAVAPASPAAADVASPTGSAAMAGSGAASGSGR